VTLGVGAGRHAARQADGPRPRQGYQQIGDRVFLRWSADEAHLFDAKTELRLA
jgi:hypothetical protein